MDRPEMGKEFKRRAKTRVLVAITLESLSNLFISEDLNIKKVKEIRRLA